MFLTILLFSLYLSQLIAIIPYDGIIHRSSDGSSYGFLAPPKIGNHASFIEQMTPSGTLAIAWFSGGEQQPNCSIAVSLLELGSQKFIIVSTTYFCLNQYNEGLVKNVGNYEVCCDMIRHASASCWIVMRAQVFWMKFSRILFKIITVPVRKVFNM
jgi:hypothetical protein